MDVALIEARGVVRDFSRRRRTVRALDGVDLRLEAGEAVALVGESGGGKTTLVRLLLGLLRPTEGEVRFGAVGGPRALPIDDAAGRRELRARLQLVSQDPHTALDPAMAVGAAIEEGYLVQHPELGRAERRERVAGLMSALGLRPEYAGRLPSALSGGEKRRVVLARALAALGYGGPVEGPPRALIADEPTAGLDAVVRAHVLRVLREQREAGRLACLLVSHDLDVVRGLADRVVVLYGGQVVEQGTTDEVLSDPRHPYTQQLVASRRLGDGDETVRAGDREEGGAGCAFAGGCLHPRKDDRCSERPPLEGERRRVRCWYA